MNASRSSFDLAVALVSGGLDSCVAAAIALESHGEVAFLHVSYGQLTEERERRAFREIADYYGVQRRLEVSIGYLAAIGGSSLTDRRLPVPEREPDGRSIPSTYVPFRNTHLLSIAVSWAEVIGATRVYIGAVETDSSGYPDCREVFFDAFNRLVEVGTRPETQIEVVAPLVRMPKSDIVREGLRLGAPLHLTWSCYQRSDVACGRCESCILRRRAFEAAGVDDPVAYVCS